MLNSENIIQRTFKTGLLSFQIILVLDNFLCYVLLIALYFLSLLQTVTGTESISQYSVCCTFFSAQKLFQCFISHVTTSETEIKLLQLSEIILKLFQQY